MKNYVESLNNYFTSLSEEQPDVRFFGLRLVRFVSAIFGSVFLFTFLVTLFDTSTLDWKLDVEGLKFFFLDAMKVPGSILAFYLAVLGLIGANHRSEQTKKQIEEARVQNDFANYYKHKEEFLKHVEDIAEGYYFIPAQRVRIHHWFFPNSRHQKFQINPECTHSLDSYISAFAGYISVLVEESSYQGALNSLENLHKEIETKFSMKSTYNGDFKCSLSRNTGWDSDFSDYVKQFVDVFKRIDTLFQFDQDYEPSEKMGYLLDFSATWPKVDTLDFNDLEASQVEAYKKIARTLLES
ncbi:MULTISPECIES: hypothetical protein [Vibrio]|uniref:hypothetical protein n=1 Tax=Vibrio TaxID=662 RepID=UPI00112345B6|nr:MULTISPECIES: hypothetical protein [Vibrio]MCA2465994.1 hypothetical protein [Vibrio alginolyticus]MDW1564516.1 hypothetical protein [Vibrio sp. YT-15]MDW2194872.1 hypothetical protein [Vibrio sp. 2084]TOE82559.1 hypothetical protein CGJ34_15720 [Vibrio parahaemolyticus]